MDKVRAFFRVLWVQRFWVLSVVGVLVAMLSWMMASGSLQEEFAANRGKIDSKFNEMSAISQTTYHGNKGVNEKNLEEASSIRKKVVDLWQKLYDKQREEVLKWPDVLGEDFLAQVEDKKFQDPINDPDMQQRYWNYIKKRFDGLVEIVDAQKMAPGQAGSYGGGDMSSLFQPDAYESTGGEMRGAPGEPEEEPYLVKWVDQGELRQRLEFAARPTSLQIWVTQEDLWVYANLLHAIANTNKEKNATRLDNAAIKGILQLNVGQAAAAAMNERGQIIIKAADPAAGGEFAGEMGGMEAGREMGEFAGESGMLAEGADPDSVLLARRYVDQTGAPIPDASAGFGTEYRRLPIRMRLWMDQRWIPKILVECANAPLPVEVQRLRINPSQSGVGFDAAASNVGSYGGAGFGGEMGRGAPGGYGGEFGRGGGGMSFSAPMGDMASSNTEFAEVDIQGLVYIFNEPDATALAVPGEEAAAPADETVAATGDGVVR
jgi:hypothetical protein